MYIYFLTYLFLILSFTFFFLISSMFSGVSTLSYVVSKSSRTLPSFLARRRGLKDTSSLLKKGISAQHVNTAAPFSTESLFCKRTFMSSAIMRSEVAEGDYFKTSTGLVGLAVNKNARNEVIELQKKMLKNIQKIPADAEYRKVVEATATYRLRQCESISDPEKLEESFENLQLEEIIQESLLELDLMEQYAQWKFWETDEVNAAVMEDALKGDADAGKTE